MHLVALGKLNDERCIIDQRTYLYDIERATIDEVKKIEISRGGRNAREKPFFSRDISFRVVTSRRVIRKAVKSNDSSFSTFRPSHTTKSLGLSGRRPTYQPPSNPVTRNRICKGSRQRPIFHITPRNMDNRKLPLPR